MNQQSSTAESSDQVLATVVTAVGEKKEISGDENKDEHDMKDIRVETPYTFHYLT